MCGICGGMAFNEKGGKYLNKLPAALECLRLRGPDQKGIYVDQAVAIGQTRLSVIDLSDAASQPFTDTTGRYTIVFNGEIYNFKELRTVLEKVGVTFRSQSDTEVLLYSYILQGPSFVEKLNGFFAFCIYDKEENQLFIARDRMGIKPLYIYTSEDVLLFGSEMKALTALGIPKQIDSASLYTYLQLNYIPAPASIFKDVKKMMPGTTLTVKDGRCESRVYYSIPYAPVTTNYDDYDTAIVRIRELMDLSVQRRMIADVPLGTFLSGGIDSSIITGLAARHTAHLKTFSIGFKDEALFDETRYAEEIARLHKTDHQSFRLSNDDLFDILPDVLEYTDEPFADSSALAVYILSRETRRHVTVALSGDGADEIYGGYYKHRAEYRIQHRGTGEKLAGMGAPLWEMLPKSRNSKLGNKVRQLHRFAEGASMNPCDRYWRWASLGSTDDAGSLFLPSLDVMEEFKARKASLCADITTAADLNEVLLNDMHVVLLNDMLVKVDMMSMANSLEVRVPFLDHEHVGYAFSLPWFYKLDRNNGKKILKDAFKEMLPDSIINRPKHGFEVPLLKWFRTGLRNLVHEELLHEDRIREQGLFNADQVKKLLQKLDSPDPGDSAARVWALLVFQYWWNKHF
jgi:asparagine synthase (glutamine-hydrolysing)